MRQPNDENKVLVEKQSLEDIETELSAIRGFVGEAIKRLTQLERKVNDLLVGYQKPKFF